MAVIRATVKAAAQFLTDPRLWLVVAGCSLASLLCFVGLWWLVRAGVGWISAAWPSAAGWLHYGQGTLGFIAALLLFPATFIFLASFFQERVADIVESRHYPELPPANGAPLWQAMTAAARLFMVILAVNILALPVYLALFWFLGTGAFLMLAVNGLITGREYFEITALRRMSASEMHAIRSKNRFPLFLAGTAIASLGFIPVLNLIAPVVGIAIMVHICHGRQLLAGGAERSSAGLS